jgi:hypothetical protein
MWKPKALVLVVDEVEVVAIFLDNDARASERPKQAGAGRYYATRYPLSQQPLLRIAPPLNLGKPAVLLHYS